MLNVITKDEKAPSFLPPGSNHADASQCLNSFRQQITLMKNGALAMGGLVRCTKESYLMVLQISTPLSGCISCPIKGATEFWIEVKMISRLRHCNIMPSIGYCKDGKKMAFVYEYMHNANLYDHLLKKGTLLTWSQWLKICIRAAHGLDSLHTGTGTQQRVIHRDVKSSNILLDQNFAARIADFGLAKIGSTNQTCTYNSTTVKGTFGYMDPNYLYTGRLTKKKSDVYAFGVILLEVFDGNPWEIKF